MAMRHFLVGLWRLFVMSLALFFAEMIVGIPFGFFQSELDEIMGLLASGALSQVASCIVIFFVCFYFAIRWTEWAMWRSLLAVIFVEASSFGLSSAFETPLPPLLLLIAGTFITLASAVGGALAGGSRARH